MILIALSQWRHAVKRLSHRHAVFLAPLISLAAASSSALLPQTSLASSPLAPEILYPHQAVITLRRQYRMSADIMALGNTLVYCGAMQCGSQAVAQGRLQLPRFQLLAGPALSGARGTDPRWPSWLAQV